MSRRRTLRIDPAREDEANRLLEDRAYETQTPALRERVDEAYAWMQNWLRGSGQPAPTRSTCEPVRLLEQVLQASIAHQNLLQALLQSLANRPCCADPARTDKSRPASSSSPAERCPESLYDLYRSLIEPPKPTRHDAARKKYTEGPPLSRRNPSIWGEGPPLPFDVLRAACRGSAANAPKRRAKRIARGRS